MTFLGKKHTAEHIAQMKRPRPYLQGRIPWNKGKGKRKFATKKDKNTHYNLKRKFGIGTDEYNILLKNQSYVCAICSKDETKKIPSGGVAKLAVDHCHKTNKIRGLLCGNCNLAIGHLQDNPYLCERAMNYLLIN